MALSRGVGNALFFTCPLLVHYLLSNYPYLPDILYHVSKDRTDLYDMHRSYYLRFLSQCVRF